MLYACELHKAEPLNDMLGLNNSELPLLAGIAVVEQLLMGVAAVEQPKLRSSDAYSKELSGTS